MLSLKHLFSFSAVRQMLRLYKNSQGRNSSNFLGHDFINSFWLNLTFSGRICIFFSRNQNLCSTEVRCKYYKTKKRLETLTLVGGEKKGTMHENQLYFVRRRQQLNCFMIYNSARLQKLQLSWPCGQFLWKGSLIWFCLNKCT